MNVFSLLSFLSFVICVYLAGYVFRLDARSRSHQVFVALCASLGIWAFAYMFVYHATDDPTRWFWYRISALGWTTFAAFALHFFLEFGGVKAVRKGWVLALLYAPALVFAWRAWTGVLLSTGFLSGPLGTVEVQNPGGIWYTAYSVFYLGYMAFGLAVVWRHGNRARTDLGKRQARLIAYSGAATTVLGSLTNVVLPGIGLTTLPAIAPMLVLIWLSAVWYSIVRYRLMAPTLSVAVDEILSKIKDVILLVDLDGRVLQVNEQAADLLGYAQQALLSTSARALAKDGERLSAELGRVLRGEIPSAMCDMDLKSRAGKLIPARVWISPVADHAQQTNGAVLIAQDLRQQRRLEEEVAERRLGEHALRRQNEHLNALHETTLNLIGSLELEALLEGIVTRAAALAGTQHGYIYLRKPGEPFMELLVGTGVMAAEVGHRIQAGEGVAGTVWESGHSFIVDDYHAWENRSKHFDAHDFRTVAGVPLRSGGEVIGMIGLVYLDPEAKFSEDEVNVLNRFASLASVALDNARLYAEVQEELDERRRTETALRAAKDDAEAASRAKTTFLANMSHELRTPLNAIIGYADMMQEEAADDGLDRYVDDLKKITKAGRHLLSMIQDILDLAKIEAGKMDMTLDEIDLSALVEDIALGLKPQADSKGLSFSSEVDDDIGTVTVDVPKLRTVLQNVVSNAVKFTESGTVEIRASKVVEGEATWVRVLVTDTGIGLAAEQVEQLFEPFTQADASATRKYGGTGLGLALSRRMCRLMGGDILVSSVEGKGSIFEVRIPPRPRVSTRRDRTDLAGEGAGN